MSPGTSQIEALGVWLRKSRAATILAVIILTALPVVCIGTAAYYSAEHALTEQISSDNLEQTLAVREIIEGYMHERVQDILALAGSDPMKQPARSADVAAALAEFLKVYGMYRGVMLWDAQGRLVARAGEGKARGVEFMQLPKVLGDGATLAQLSRSSAGMSIRLVSPIRKAFATHLTGVICAELPVSEVWKFLHAITSLDDEYFISDGQGIIFLATEANDVGKSIRSVFPALTRLADADQAGTAVVESSTSGKRYLVAYAPSAGIRSATGLGWGFVVGTRLDIAFAPQRRLLGIVAVGTVITALLAAVICFAITRSATHFLMAELEDRKEIARQLVGARDLALEAGRLKSEFLANMSHEIRTPLNGIIGMSGLLMETTLSEEQREFAHVINGSADALLAIVNDILDFSKIAAGKLVLEELDFELALAVEGVVDLLAERAHQKGIELALAIDLDVPRYVRGDAARLRQALTNLVGNAVKFTEQGEVVVRVGMLSATEQAIVLRFQVTDTGIGIDPQAKERLFEAFSQADNSTTRKYGGTGLGLAIAKQLVECMGGSIEVQSRPGQGSTFQFTVRLGRSTHTGAALAGRADLNGMRVLVVDDNATNCEILQRQLTGWGVVSHSASSGAQALAMLRDHAAGLGYDLAIIDLEMPGMDGLTLAQLVKTDPVISDVRLLIMSSRGGRGDVGERSAQIEGWLIKPVKASQLFRVLTAVLGAEKGEPASAQPLAVSAGDSRIREMRGNIRVLLAEDNPVAQKVAVRQLEKLGFGCEVAPNGKIALEFLERTFYPIVLMDCQMPELDGYQATRELRRRKGLPRHIIIAMTANALQGDREKCLAAGMDDYITKPVKIEEIAAVLDRWLIQAVELQSSHRKGESSDAGSLPPSV